MDKKTKKQVITSMKDENLAKMSRFLDEASLQLRKAGYETQEVESRYLPVSWEGTRLCLATGGGMAPESREPDEHGSGKCPSDHRGYPQRDGCNSKAQRHDLRRGLRIHRFPAGGCRTGLPPVSGQNKSIYSNFAGIKRDKSR